jgi:hypothetical protein
MTDLGCEALFGGPLCQRFRLGNLGAFTATRWRYGGDVCFGDL